MTYNNSKTQFATYTATATATVAALIFVLAINTAKAEELTPFSQQPVPSYSPVISTNNSTLATVPDNLAKEWRGLYTKRGGSLITSTSVNFDGGIKELLNAWLEGRAPKTGVVTYKFNPAKVYEWTGQIASSVNAKASEPSMKVENGRVTEFTPPQTGKFLDRYTSTLKIIEQLSQGNNQIELAVNSTQPTQSLEGLGNLGLKELIGRGESKFNGSPANRRWNIKVGVQKMTGIIVRPGEEFSFNKYLGPVEASTGFKPELVIKAEGTIPEFGGGLCQVSSTTFRAAMHAGLPITARRNHSYAVQYYAPQGTDATIYPGVQDLKFTNDTGNNILIWPYFKDDNYLIFDFYGTYDGRKVELGTPYSYDRKGDGSMKANWKRTVTRVGKEPTYDNFFSLYQPPAKFHKQETFVTAPTTPVTPVLAPPTSDDENTNNTQSNSNSNSAP